MRARVELIHELVDERRPVPLDSFQAIARRPPIGARATNSEGGSAMDRSSVFQATGSPF